MDKRFNIHDWQAKQRLAEEKYNRLPIRDNVMGYASQILNQINDYENNVSPFEQRIDYSGTRAAVEALMGAVDRDEEGMMNEHHDDEDFPKLPKEVKKFLDKLRRANKKVYDQVEDIIIRQAKEKNEASMTGGGASFNAGAGEGYMTPNAFKKKRKNN
tara:strand:- start:50 stop:523 length:474 start_codon:yes stop_codon:yes gene_type:complete